MKKSFLYINLFILFSLNVSANDFSVKTSSGISTGYISNKVINWDDIPYAQPPIGDLRWKAPRLINDFDNLNTITPQKDNFCVQEPSGLGGSDGDGYFSGREDCLYLDIKKPNRANKELLPVMFWIHGGGNTSGMKDLYDFSKWLKNIMLL